MDRFIDRGYHWNEVTTIRDADQRVFQRGLPVSVPNVKPWIIQTLSGDKAGWLDDQNQEHWLPVDVDGSVQGWRRMYVEKRA